MGCTVWCGGGDTGVYGGGGGAGLTTMSGECSAQPRFFSFGYGGDMGAGAGGAARDEVEVAGVSSASGRLDPELAPEAGLSAAEEEEDDEPWAATRRRAGICLTRASILEVGASACS